MSVHLPPLVEEGVGAVLCGANSTAPCRVPRGACGPVCDRLQVPARTAGRPQGCP